MTGVFENRESEPQRWPPWLAFTLPLLAGVFLRLWGLGEQVLGGDEIHALRALLGSNLAEILTTYRVADPCLPYTGLLYVLSEAGVPMTEWTLRLPVLLAGLVSLWVLPQLLRPWIRRDQRLVFAWLLALSPILVLYSRIARPYGIVVLLSFAALVSFLRWWRGDGGSYGAAYALLASLCGYFHILVMPLLVAPFFFAAGTLLWRRFGRGASSSKPASPEPESPKPDSQSEAASRRSPGWSQVVILAVGTGLAVALWLLPATPSLLRLLESKSGEGRAEIDVLATLQQQFGTSWVALALLAFALACWGWLRLATAGNPDQHRLVGLVVSAALLQLTALMVVAPMGVDRSVILNRYLIPLTPWLLLGLAVGTIRLAALARLPWRSRTSMEANERSTPTWVLVGVVAVFFLGSSWLARPDGPSWAFYFQGSFSHHRDALAFEEPLLRLPEHAIPEVYRELHASSRKGDRVLEVPVQSAWRFARSAYVYQRFHGMPVRAATFDPYLCHPRWRLRQRPCLRVEAQQDSLDAERWRSEGVRFLIVHLEPRKEERQVLRDLGLRLPRERHNADHWEVSRHQAWEFFRAFRRRWGKPHLRQETIAVWDLDRLPLRAGSTASEPEGQAEP